MAGSLIAMVFLLIYVAFFLLGVWMIVRGIRGPISTSDPHCRTCRYDLRQVLIADSPNCPECGADLGERRAVVFGRPRRRPWLAVAGVGVILLPLLASLVVGFFVVRQRTVAPIVTMGGPTSFVTMTNVELANAVGQNPSGPWIWDQLASRRESGTIAGEELEGFMDSVAAAIENGIVTPSAITPWSGNQMHELVRNQTLAEKSRKRLANAIAPNATLRMWPRMKQGAKRFVRLDLDGVNHARSNDLLTAVHSLRIVGDDFEREVETQDGRFGRPTDPPARFAGTDALASRFTLPDDLPIGQYEIHVDVELAMVFDKSPLLDDRRRPRHPDLWSKSAVRRRSTITTPLEVISADQAVVEYMSSEESAAAAKAFHDAIGHVALRVKRDPGGKLKLTLLVPSDRRQQSNTRPTYCFEIVAILGGIEVPMQLESGRNGGRSTRGRGATIDALPADVTTAVIEYRPAPDEADTMLHPEDDGTLPVIIGETVRFENVEVERRDL